MGGWVEDGRCVAEDLKHVKPDHKERYRFAAKWLANRIGKCEILDLCSGTGYGGLIMAEWGHKVICMEQNESTVSKGDHWFHHPRVTRIVANVVTEPFPNCDAVTCFEGIEHIQDPRPVVEKILSASRFFFCSVPNEAVVPFCDARNPYHFRHYTPGELRSFLSCMDLLFLGGQDQGGIIDRSLRKRTLYAICEAIGSI